MHLIGAVATGNVLRDTRVSPGAGGSERTACVQREQRCLHALRTRSREEDRSLDEPGKSPSPGSSERGAVGDCTPKR